MSCTAASEISNLFLYTVIDNYDILYVPVLIVVNCKSPANGER